MFPTDIPAGPSTKLYIGRLDFSIDAGGTWTMLSRSGTQFDICAALQ